MAAAVICGRIVSATGLVLLVCTVLLALLLPSSFAVDDGRKLSDKPAGSMYRLIAGTESSDSCSTDFSTVNFADVKSACPPNAVSPNAACCAAYKTAACQYSNQVNDFNSMCPMMFINYLSAVGPYPAGYFVGNCVSGTSGLCSSS